MGFLDRLLAPAGYTPPIDPNAPQGVGGMPSAAQALAAPPPDALPPGVGQGGIADPTSAAPAINMNSPTLKDVQIGAPPGGSPQPIAGPPPGLLESMAMRDVPGVNDAPPQGFLGRLTATDPNGVTFRDKLMALGSILKGDNEGATKYLENQQAKAMQLRQAVMARNMASIQAQAFAKSFRDDGTFDPRAYAA